MDLLQIVLLAIVQGLTEFLPISSSAHLVLLSAVLGWQDQGLFMDIAAHTGSLLAVVMYFKVELGRLARNVLAPVHPQSVEAIEDRRLVLGLIIASIPIMLAGFAINDDIEHFLRTIWVIAAATIGFGLLLGWAGWRAKGNRSETELSIIQMLLIGAAQALAIIPGTSRSGITITAGLFLGMSAVAASRFSFLLAIPAISMAGGYKVLQTLGHAHDIDWGAVLIIFCLSAATAYACIHVFIRFVNVVGMQPFVIYRLLLGIFLLVFFV